MPVPSGVGFTAKGLTGPPDVLGQLTAEMHRRAPYWVREAALTDLASREPAPRRGIGAHSFGFGGVAAQARHQPNMALAQRPLAILFADLEGYSRLCHRLSLEVIWATMTRWWQAAADTIYSTGGWVNKVDGDGVMALFGLQDTGVPPATSAATCALRIIHQYAVYVGKTDVLIQHEVGIRVGLAAGNVMCGATRLGPQPVYDVLGPPVNLASDLQNAAPTNGILVDPEVRSTTGTQFEYSDAGIQVGRPVEAGVPAYRLVGGSA